MLTTCSGLHSIADSNLRPVDRKSSILTTEPHSCYRVENNYSLFVDLYLGDARAAAAAAVAFILCLSPI